MRRLVAENGWLREELANTQTKLCDAEQRATKAEEERAHFKVTIALKTFPVPKTEQRLCFGTLDKSQNYNTPQNRF